MMKLSIRIIVIVMALNGSALAQKQSLSSNTPAIESIKSAIWRNDIRYLQGVFSATTDLNIADRNAWTPLHHAVKWDRFRVATYLLSKGANPNAESIHKVTPIYLAASQGDLSMVKLLLEYKANVNILDEEGNSPLHQSAANNKEAKITNLLLTNGANPNAVNDQKRTPLMGVCHNTDIARTLINNGANVNVRDLAGNTPLHFAVLYECQKTILLLLENGSDPNAINSKGVTPLDIAKKRNNVALIKIFSK